MGVYTALAATLRHQQRPDEAELVLRSATTRFPNETTPWHDLGRLLEEGQRWAEAEACWRHFLALDDSQSWAHTALAASLNQQDRGDEAEAVLRAAAVRFPQQIEHWTYLAQAAERRERWDEAAEYWRHSHALPDRGASVDWALVAVLMRQHRWEEAETGPSSAQERFPDEAMVFASRHAQMAEQRLDWPLALRRWESFSVRFPDEWLGHGGQIGALRQIGRVDDAARLIEAALDGGQRA